MRKFWQTCKAFALKELLIVICLALAAILLTWAMFHYVIAVKS